ncbi:MAG: nitrilase-related carbon-nitrogen hydrolase [Paracoccaceae bacterium]
MRLALWQDHSPMGDQASAMTRIEQAAVAAGAMGAAILVLPEVFLPGYNHPRILDCALPRRAPLFDQIGAIARAAHCGIVLGYAEQEGHEVFNAALAFDAQGNAIAHYRKIQLFGPRERALYTPGTKYTIIELHGRKAALLICYDIEFSAHVAALAADGVTLVLVPTANMEPYDHVVRHTIATMAANHGVTIVYANYCGSEGDLTYVGGSLIAGPHGEVLAQAGRVPALLVADVPERDPARISTQIADYRQPLPVPLTGSVVR